MILSVERGITKTKKPMNVLSLFDGLSCGQLVSIKSNIRRLTPTECERLQTVKDGYTAHVSDSQRYKMLGNGWTVDVIAYILGYIDH